MDHWSVIADERRRLADVLDTLTDDQWAHPSLCAGWSVKDVAAHVMVGPTSSPRASATAMLKARGSVDRAMRLMAAQRAEEPTEALVACLRDEADSPFAPPVVGWLGPLADIRLHSLDITVPLGIDVEFTSEPWRVIFDFLVSWRARVGFIPGGRPALTLVADDAGWQHGAGPRVAGPAASLAMALCRRPAGLARLDGPGVAALERWVRS
ncbi:maleylpyruvate isomerase family mycothiol-dependent enzyme [Nocardioides acrostichi]|uniref:Maleylpyruvate isomerase family mycothiol-dependent enzyme n=1 Tax=Nocardioides acrostichi TaxID=2784339 RepID=A0A930Y7T2_9ACTN|nr:maleylpyruvate isomerase family mycothiol-dependent enzyme [Nocardioides acrostichi]MBF4162321.1 maleylpyruvate isomerase family mycothiol-dependent enzyme [Nocardioides acrostichi]